MEYCCHQECPKRRISCSEFCGEHTENNAWLSKVLQFSTADVKNMHNAYISEVEIKDAIIISGKCFTDCEINDCEFRNITLQDCIFDNCRLLNIELYDTNFIRCKFNETVFDEADLFDCNMDNCTFENCEIINTQIADNSFINNCSFDTCKLSNFDLFEIRSTKDTKFKQSIFTRCCFNDSNLDSVIFKYVEFLKTSFSRCSLRDSKFINVDTDFRDTGPPIACDFYNCKMEEELKQYLSDFFNNFDSEMKIDFINKSITELTKLKHPNYLSELNYFISEYGNINNIRLLKETVLNHYNDLYLIAVNTNNLQMAGSIINQYTHLPDEIREHLLQLSNNSSKLNHNKASVSIKFFQTGEPGFKSVYEINRSLYRASCLSCKQDQIKVESITHGSLVEVISGALSEIFVFAGLIYVFTKAALVLTKDSMEIKKISAETKKIKLESELLQQDVNKKTQQENRSNQYLDSIKHIDQLPGFDYDKVEKDMQSGLKDSDFAAIITDLNIRHEVLEITIEYQSEQNHHSEKT